MLKTPANHSEQQDSSDTQLSPRGHHEQPPSTLSRVLKWFLAILAVSAIILVVGIIMRSLIPKPVDRSVLTHRVSRGDLSVIVTENGTVESSNNKEIKCLVKGGSTVLWVIDTGTMVKPGDVLVRLDQSQIEDNILAQQIVYENALANKITAESDVAVAEKSITEYLEGTYIEERGAIEKEIFDAEQALAQAELAYKSSTRMAAKGLIKTLQLQGEKFAVDSARKELELKEVRLDALEKYKKDKQVQLLNSTLRAAKARLASFDASLQLEKTRLDREREQLKNCVIESDTSGMVIFPSMAEWKSVPDIEEGATVREQQTLLIIPDVDQMQVVVGIHESKVDRLRIGMSATVELQDKTLSGSVKEIAEVTKPAGWWTGNVVKYDTIIELPQHEGLKPGMSALVDVVLAEHDDVLQLPVAAVLESTSGYLCWVKTADGVKRRVIELGDTNDEFTIVTAGLAEGDDVVLNPLAFVEEAQRQAMQPSENDDSETSQTDPDWVDVRSDKTKRETSTPAGRPKKKKDPNKKPGSGKNSELKKAIMK